LLTRRAQPLDMNVKQFVGLPRGEQEPIPKEWTLLDGGYGNLSKDSLVGKLWNAAPQASRDRFSDDIQAVMRGEPRPSLMRWTAPTLGIDVP
jgi:hypothetical protein